MMNGIGFVIRENLIWFLVGVFVSLFVVGGLIVPLFVGYALALVGYRLKRGDQIMFVQRTALLVGGFMVVIGFIFHYSLTYIMIHAAVYGVTWGIIAGNGLKARRY